MKKTTFLLLALAATLQLWAQSKAPGVFGATEGTKNARVSALVVDAQTGEVIDCHQPDILMIPASCTKLWTTCTALELLGADYRVSTYLETDGTLEDGVLTGNLYIRGTGDPSLGSKKVGNPAFMTQWVNAIRRYGIREIRGNVIGDLSEFTKHEAANSCWSKGDLGNGYAPGIFSIAYMDNVLVANLKSGAPGTLVEVTGTTPDFPEVEFVNSVKAAKINYDGAYVKGEPYTYKRYLTGIIPANREDFGLKGDIPNTGLLIARHLKSALEADSIAVTGEATYMNERTDSTERVLVYAHESEPLSELVRETNIISNNMYAETLFRHLGLLVSHPASISGSLQVERQCWAERGVDLTGANMNDGCGLARKNQFTARQFVSLLQYMRTSPQYDAFYASLPVSGESGTLKKLLKDSPLHGRVHAKSGTLTGVKSYSGYIEVADGKTYVFSVLVNNSACGGDATMNVIGKYLLAVCGM